MRTRFLLTLALGIILGSTLSSMIAMAWTGPTASPPGNNVNGVIVTVGDQIINGILSLNGTVIYGNTLLSGSNRYVNFGSTSGSSGYGIRDNAGILEFKSSGGSWASLSASWVNLSTVNGITPNGLGQITSIKFGDGTTQTTAASASGDYIAQFCSMGYMLPSSVQYGSVMNCFGVSSEENYTSIIMPRGGTARNLYVTIPPTSASTPQPSSGSLVFTFRKNGADTSLSVTIPAGSGAGFVTSDTTHSVTFAAGDKLDMKYVNNATGNSANVFYGTLSF